ncbi:uncharacterized protein LOC107635241 [Arachis ipaensis]|uniref:uncharacterized protein LOC107635241 n=1 Tax=Arachis ipaensis TaxID=130454 RepID=UPI0007AEFC82|nr:uncharacterized protein LOC107635241 [Arachis ipaensis]XP_016194135.1 uncharacterized protein LOC107635241 [Arachis ipaensis]XP_025649767.1 uncharacterized protein LOC112744375 [Arachis hypogaea]XP_029148178.1 uncharacterized protein LOC112744375 [Arachis hypogaea]
MEEGDAHGRGRNCLCTAVVHELSRLAIVAAEGLAGGEEKMPSRWLLSSSNRTAKRESARRERRSRFCHHRRVQPPSPAPSSLLEVGGQASAAGECHCRRGDPLPSPSPESSRRCCLRWLPPNWIRDRRCFVFVLL